MVSYETPQVYVPVGLPSITFVKRENLERSVKAWEMNKSKHLLIFGPSKSGKTSLWRKYVSKESVIKVPCNSNKSIIDVYSEILFELNSFYTVEKQEELGLKSGFLAEMTGLLGLFTAKAQAHSEVNTSNSDKRVPVTSPNIGVNLLIKYLKPSRKIIILEDFHYANDELKHQLSQDLKAFSDDECPWIIVGIQHKTSKLLSYNIDLQQRIAEIPVEGFTDEQLIKIIELGESALNIKFSPEIKTKILEEAIGSASLVQNICQRICIMLNITCTSINQVEINNPAVLYTACKDIAYENKHYYEDVIKNIALGGRSDGSTEKYKWFLKLIRDVDVPEHGLRNTEILNFLKELGHKGIKQGSVTSGLGYLPRLLEKLNFPSFFDYDVNSKTFYLLDKYIKFVFKWIPEMIDELFDEIPSENDEKSGSIEVRIIFPFTQTVIIQDNPNGTAEIQNPLGKRLISKKDKELDQIIAKLKLKNIMFPSNDFDEFDPNNIQFYLGFLYKKEFIDCNLVGKDIIEINLTKSAKEKLGIK